MILIAIGWMYVVLMMAAAEALSAQGSLLGAFVTLVLYGIFPLSIVLYIVGTPGRRRLRRAAERAEKADGASGAPDRRGHPPGDPVAAEREEP